MKFLKYLGAAVGMFVALIVIIGITSSVNSDGPRPSTHETSVNSAEITTQEFERITPGLTLVQVQEIVGSPGELVSESTVGDYHSVTISWKGASLGSNAVVIFDGDTVTSKAQLGL